MERKVPQSIKERIIKQKDIPDIDLLREVALLLKNKDLDLVVLADSIRLKKKLDDMDLNEDQIESLIEISNIHCFKRGLSAEEFVNIINKAVALSQNLGIPVDQLANYILEQQLELQKLKGETEDAEVKQLQVLRDYNINMNDLEEYRRNKPLVDRIRQLDSINRIRYG